MYQEKNYSNTFPVLLSISVIAKEYHVDCNNMSIGEDSIDNPFKTVPQAANLLKKGDVCNIHKGTYSMSFISNNEIPNIDWTGATL